MWCGGGRALPCTTSPPPLPPITPPPPLSQLHTSTWWCVVLLLRCCCHPNTAAPPVQHSSGPLSLRVHAPQETLLQEREQRGGSAPALHQVLHGGAVLQHGHPAPGEVDLHHQEGKAAARDVDVSVGQERHSQCSCPPHVNLDVGVCLFQLLAVELCSLL